MTLQQKKELYEQGNHICVLQNKLGSVRWSINYDPRWYPLQNYFLIHKKHSHILDAYLDGCEVILYGEVSQSKYPGNINFIEWYKPEHTYYAIPKSLENCYCEATEFHYGKLVTNTLKYLPEEEAEYPNCKVYHIKKYSFSYLYEDWSVPNTHKQIEWSTQINNWVYCPKETEDDDTTTTNELLTTYDVHNTMDSDTDSTINNFETYGFTADFEGEIDNVYKDSMNVLHGRLVKDNRAIRWNHRGICTTHSSLYDLTPIVKEVYPMFKKTSTGIFRFDNETSRVAVLHVDEDLIGHSTQNICPHVLTDVPYDTERDLYHGQPCFINWHETYRIVFYIGNGIFRDRYQDYDEGFGEFASYRQIPLKTLQHMPWVWEQCKALEL